MPVDHGSRGSGFGRTRVALSSAVTLQAGCQRHWSHMKVVCVFGVGVSVSHGGDIVLPPVRNSDSFLIDPDPNSHARFPPGCNPSFSRCGEGRSRDKPSHETNTFRVPRMVRVRRIFRCSGRTSHNYLGEHGVNAKPDTATHSLRRRVSTLR